MNEYILSMKNITKVYSNGFIANKNINLNVKKGEIHALAGENGAGKSTLMKILFGIEQPTEGKIILKGKEIKIESPISAINNGIGMVHQHFMLAQSLTVAENMIMGIEPKKFGLIDYDKAYSMVEEICEKYNFDIDPKAKVGDLPVGVKQKIEILKALLRGAEVLILDEPTAVLTPQETKELFVQLKKLKDNGHTIIFISHKLKEIKEICDSITILRNGKLIEELKVNDVSEQEISRKMVGRDVVLKVEKEKAAPTEVILSVRDLKVTDSIGKKKLNGVNFDVRKGQILGIAGIEGNGQREIAETITGLLSEYEGIIKIKDIDIKSKRIREIRELGTSHIPEDRMTYGVSSEVSITDNLIVDRYYKEQYNKKIIFNEKVINEEVDSLIKSYLIKCDDREQPIYMLSGGNIQKVVVAREFSSNPSLIIVNQPTRGIDVGSIEFVRKRIVELRDQGVAILLISADLNEVLELSDSLIVVCDGSIAAYFDDSNVVTEEELGEYMLGINKMSDEAIGGAIYEKEASSK